MRSKSRPALRGQDEAPYPIRQILKDEGYNDKRIR
jgi:hypothetical protein